MFKEYAVDPETIASSWDTHRILMGLFGFHRGRLISKFPKHWKRLAIEAAQKLTEGRKQERIVESLNQIGKSNNVLIKSGREYPNNDCSWLDNAIVAHYQNPFSAIISSVNRGDCDAVLCDEDCTEEHPLLHCPRELIIPKTPEDLSLATALLLYNSKCVRFIDPYFDPSQSKWINSTKAFLERISNPFKTECEIHYLETDNPPDPAVRYNALPKLANVVPEAMSLKILRWQRKEGGERFHARYLLTEHGGLRFDSGLDEADENETTDVTILDRELHRNRWQMFNRDSKTFCLQNPIYIVTSDGKILEQHIEEI
ncbi:MAG: hypothetical protein MJE63_29565 [Proteobacteria bacterium]|nr:hypothetical protein [Pseudomonadota bacterium]